MREFCIVPDSDARPRSGLSTRPVASHDDHAHIPELQILSIPDPMPAALSPLAPHPALEWNFNIRIFSHQRFPQFEFRSCTRTPHSNARLTRQLSSAGADIRAYVPRQAWTMARLRALLLHGRRGDFISAEKDALQARPRPPVRPRGGPRARDRFREIASALRNILPPSRRR